MTNEQILLAIIDEAASCLRNNLPVRALYELEHAREMLAGPPRLPQPQSAPEPKAPREELGGWRCEYTDCQEWNEHSLVSCKTCCRLRVNRRAE